MGQDTKINWERPSLRIQLKAILGWFSEYSYGIIITPIFNGIDTQQNLSTTLSQMSQLEKDDTCSNLNDVADG